MRALVLALALVTACAPPPVGPAGPDPLPGPLVRTVEVPPGDGCAGGGVAILSGRDDGAGGGTAGDGVLQDGEVRERELVCAPVLPEPPDPDSPWLPLAAPLGPPGERVLSASGGSAVDDDGGPGGKIVLYLDPPSSTGHVVVHPTGSADVRLPELGEPLVSLGANPLTVDEDLVVDTVAEPTALPDGAVYLSASAPTRLFRRGSPGFVTGIDVRPGRTLTLRSTSARLVDLALSGPIRNAGTIRAVAPDDSPADLRLSCDAYVDTPEALIDARGLDGGPDAPGGPGAFVQILALSTPPQVPVRLGTVVVQGTIDTSGGAGSVGARGGAITITAVDALHVRGALRSAGGPGSSITSGVGGSIRLASEGPLTLAGTVDTSGPSDTPSGPRGGGLELSGRGVLVDADIDLSGGSVAGCAGACSGGDAGELVLTSRDAPVAWTGRLLARGGDGGSGTGGRGGRGGSVTVTTEREISGGIVVGTPDRTVTLSADIRLDGGDGIEDGGAAGTLTVVVDGSATPSSSIRLLGYAAFTLGGGATTLDSGAEGGRLDVRVGPPSFDAFATGGGIAIGVPLRMDGGCGRVGGLGGSVQAAATPGHGDPHPDREVWLTAPIEARGGCGARRGGRSGQLVVSGVFGVRLLGAFDGPAADAADPGGEGGSPGRIVASTEPLTLASRLGVVHLGAPVTLHGGDGDGTGGDGAAVRIAGWGVDWAGDVDLRGGAAARGDGGDGGFVTITVGDGGLTWTGSVDLAPGDGTGLVGTAGRLLVNGLDETAAYAP